VSNEAVPTAAVYPVASTGPGQSRAATSANEFEGHARTVLTSPNIWKGILDNGEISDGAGISLYSCRMNARLDHPIPLDLEFSAPIGVDVKGDVWSAIQIPNSAAVFGSLRSVRVDATVDDVLVENMGLMPTGSGELMLSVSAALRKKLRKDVGDHVRVVLLRRNT
jgi:hypothetical protein